MMKNKIVLSLALCIWPAVYGISVVTQADTKIEYGDEYFYFYVVNSTYEDISFCRKNSNPLIYKSDVLLKITEEDLEVEDLGEKYTSMAWIEALGRNKIEIYQLHGYFYMKFENKEEPLELSIKHVYEINLDDESHVKIKDITI